jgi:hypothetical protein
LKPSQRERLTWTSPLINCVFKVFFSFFVKLNYENEPHLEEDRYVSLCEGGKDVSVTKRCMDMASHQLILVSPPFQKQNCLFMDIWIMSNVKLYTHLFGSYVTLNVVFKVVSHVNYFF